MALELRLHDSKIHQQFVTGNDTINKILMLLNNPVVRPKDPKYLKG